MTDIQSSLRRLQESIRGLSDASALVGNTSNVALSDEASPGRQDGQQDLNLESGSFVLDESSNPSGNNSQGRAGTAATNALLRPPPPQAGAFRSGGHQNNKRRSSSASSSSAGSIFAGSKDAATSNIFGSDQRRPADGTAGQASSSFEARLLGQQLGIGRSSGAGDSSAGGGVGSGVRESAEVRV